MLPFTADVLFSVLGHYNRAIWPAQIAAYGLGLVAVLLTVRPVPAAGRLVGALLAAAWAWVGVVYHLMHLAVIDFAAPAYGALFLIQALLLAWSAAIKGKLAFRFRADLFGWAGLGLVAYALALQPLVGWLAGHGWPQAALLGVAPGPTAIFTLGLLLMAERRAPLHLIAIPVLWSLVGGARAWLLGVPEDLILPPVGIACLCLALWKNRRAGR